MSVARNMLNDGVGVPSWQELKARNYVRLPVDSRAADHVPFERFRADPAANPLGTPSGRIEIFSATIAGFSYEDVPGHLVFHASRRRLKFPLRLVSPQPGDKLHSQLQAAIEDKDCDAVVVMHPADAGVRGVQHGESIRLWSENGACCVRVAIRETIKPGIVSLPTGAWFRPAEDRLDLSGSSNVLTNDCGTSPLGQGAAAHNVAVQVEKSNHPASK